MYFTLLCVYLSWLVSLCIVLRLARMRSSFPIEFIFDLCAILISVQSIIMRGDILCILLITNTCLMLFMFKPIGK